MNRAKQAILAVCIAGAMLQPRLLADASSTQSGVTENGVIGPKVVYAPDPDLPEKARKQKLNGICVVSVLVDAEGKPQNVHILKSAAEGVSRKQRSAALSLDEQAIRAVQQYRFEPAVSQEKPIPYKTTVEINYRVY